MASPNKSVKFKKEEYAILKRKLKHLSGIDWKRANNNNPFKKQVIIINGKGGVGKDTLCASLPSEYMTTTLSSIDKIKEIAFQLGWDGTKDLKSRKFLSNLKKASEEYNDFILNNLIEAVRLTRCSLAFIQVREPKSIEKYKQAFEENGFKVTTLLIRRNVRQKSYGNKSDDNVEDYNYDIYFDNNDFIESSIIKFRILIKEILEDTLLVDSENLPILDDDTMRIVRKISIEKEESRLKLADEEMLADN